MAIPDWQTKDEDLIREACRHGESMLAAQVTLATSADQRAAVLAGIFTAVATGIIIAVATNSAFAESHALAAGAVVAIGAYLIGAALCIVTALPVDFWPPGNNPSQWYEDIEKGSPLKLAIGQQAAHFDDHIAANNKVLVRNSRIFFAGAVIGVSAPFLALAAAGITCLLCANA
ncbi:MAG: hypothetical protein ACJ8IR_08225 [Alphaproteobacteria bacterium]